MKTATVKGWNKWAQLCSNKVLLRKQNRQRDSFGSWPKVGDLCSDLMLPSLLELNGQFSCWHSSTILVSFLSLHLSFLPQTFLLSDPSAWNMPARYLYMVGSFVFSGLRSNVVSWESPCLTSPSFYHLILSFFFYPNYLNDLLGLLVNYSSLPSKMQMSQE